MKSYVAVMNIPSPYRLHSLRETWKQLKDKGIEFHCHFMARGHSDRPKSWLDPEIEFPHTYWADFGIGQYHFNPMLIWKLLRNQPDYLFCSDPFATFTGIALMLWCKKSKRLAWCEGNTQTPGKLGGVLGWIKRKVYSSSQNIVVPGLEGIRYVDLHRKKSTRLLPECVLHPNLVDETRFRPRQEWDANSIMKTRRYILSQFNASSRDDLKICIIPGRLVWDKGLEEFLSTLEPDWLYDWRIVIVGEGPLKNSIENIIDRRGLRQYVAIMPPVPYSDMPRYYASSDLFLLPSLHDANPLSVIEALHSALPIALSEKAGNLPEAIRKGRNGWALKVDEPKQYREDLVKVFSADLGMLAAMGHISSSEVAPYWHTHRAISEYLTMVL